MLKKMIMKFHDLLRHEKLNDCPLLHESDILSLYKDILIKLTESHKSYWDYYPKLLFSLEDNNATSLPYSIKIFLDCFDNALEHKEYRSLDLSITKHDWDYDDFKRVMGTFLEDGYSRNPHQRISEEYFNLDLVSDDEKKELISFFRDALNHQGEKTYWKNEDVETAFYYVIPLRQLLLYFDMPELFYTLIGSLVERLSTSEFNQINRDLVEEIIIASFKDNIPEFGFMNAFKAYSNAKSVHASLLFVNLSLTAILKKRPPYIHHYIFEIGRQAMRLFRNVEFNIWIHDIYQKLLTNLNLSDYENQMLAHLYYSSLFQDHPDNLPELLLDYLNRERENLLNGGLHSAIPWLTLLYNVRRVYPEADFSPTGLGFFINVFEYIVPPENVSHIKDILEGNSTILKSRLKESLVKLNETRNSSDFVYDNERAILIASRLIEKSFISNDTAGFILAMMLKSDYSILFRSKEASGTMPLKLPEMNLNDTDLLYENKDDFNSALQLKENTAIIWMAFSESKTYTLSLVNKEYNFSLLNKWNNHSYKQLVGQDYFFNLSFSDTVKDKWGVRLITNEEFSDQSDSIALALQDYSIPINDKINGVFLVKDMEISGYPHNLLVDEKGEFIALKMPVTNILSTEWMLFGVKNELFPSNNSKSIWIPTESGDTTINYLYSKIETTLEKYEFKINTQSELFERISSDICIICSHGAKNISETNILFPEESQSCDLSSVISNGKILIFFVCYSGSMKTEVFRNSIASVARQAISLGYEAVIAPFWALEASIPGIWLPVFLESMYNGLEIQQAVFYANAKVYERYPTPPAWACLHLYGNPLLKLQD